jgi:hypothetical protein
MVARRVEGAATENVLIKDVDDFDEYDLDSLIPDHEPDDGDHPDLTDF